MEHYKKINEHIYGTGFFSNIYCRGIFRGCKTQFLVHLVGNSGIGKSTYFINDHFAKGTYAQEKNAETLYETDQRFAETAMYHLAWELAEFDKFIEKHFEKIKTLLLASELWQRIVYAKKATKTLVSGMPFGTSNEPYIPHDQTTDKRFEVLMALASGTSLTKSIATDDVAPTYIQYCRKDIYDIGRQVSPFIQAIRNITDERNCSASEIHEIGNTFVDLTPTLKDSKGAHKKIFIKKTGEVLVDTIETFFEDAFKKIKEDKNTPYLYCQRSHLYSRIRSFHEQETREKREISDKEIKDALEGIEGIHFGKQRVVTETKKPIRFWYAGHLPDKQISNQFDMEMMPKIFPSEKDGTALK